MTVTPYQSRLREGPYGFADLLHAEWTKFRTVRGWIIAVIVGGLAIVAFALAPSQQGSCNVSGCSAPVGPGGEEVSDSFYFVHQPLAGNGSITVRVTSLTGQIPVPVPGAAMRAALVPWAKAGIIIKASTSPGSAYAAMMVTGSHGVRMQDDFTQDVAGLPGAVTAAAPRWLRLTRSGDTVTGYDSADGTHWTRVGTATLTGLPATAQVGLFATSPPYLQTSASEASISGGPSAATGVFDHVGLTWRGGAWVGLNVGGGNDGLPAGTLGFSAGAGAGTFTVTGSGDIAPAVAGGAGIGVTIADPRRHVRRAHRAGRRGRDVHHGRVPAAPVRRHAHGVAAPWPGAGRQGRRGRRGHVHGRAGRRRDRRGARSAGPARQRRVRVPGERG
jgi:regulation of enolase protein 1 (concanavalin A-like superfamily)